MQSVVPGVDYAGAAGIVVLTHWPDGLADRETAMQTIRTLTAAHRAAVDTYQLAKEDGERKGVVLARRAMRQAAGALIAAQYAAGIEPCDYMAGALPRMFRVSA